MNRSTPRFARLTDERLAALVGQGDAAAFEALYDRHHAALLAFCRHMLGNREDGEDALQQTFLRAHRALADGRTPDAVKPWLFAIARNRCRTLLAARRDAAVPVEDIEPSFDGLAGDVERRADLRELVTDLGRLPDDQRGALVLAEMGDFNHVEIAGVIGCTPAKVKALVFQARTSLIADRDARRTSCDEVRTVLETARGGLLRRGTLRRHLRQCDPCAAYRVAMERRRCGLAIVLPVAPTVGLKAAVLAGAGALGGGAETAAAAAALGAPAALGAASGGGVAGGAATAGGVAVKTLAAKAAVMVAIGAGAAGGGTAVHELAHDAPVRAATVERVAPHDSDGRAQSGARASQPQRSGAPATRAAVTTPVSRTAHRGPLARRAVARRLHRVIARRARRVAARHLRRVIARRARRVAARHLRTATPVRRARRAIRRQRLLAGAAVPPRRASAGFVVRGERPLRRRRDRPRRASPAPLPTPAAVPAPVATSPTVVAPAPRPRRRTRPIAAPVPVPASTPVPTQASSPTPAPTPTP